MKKRDPYSAAEEILRLAIEHVSYFEKHPRQLAWLMMFYSTLNYKGRVHTEDYVNPKDTIIELTQTMPEAQQHLIYDAWGVTVDNNLEFCDAYLPLEFKEFLTMEEWVSLKLDPKYRYALIYPNRRAVYEHMLCAIGTGEKWVFNPGDQLWYIAHVEAAGTNTAVFAGYTKAQAKANREIREKVTKTCKGFRCEEHVRKLIDNGRKTARGWEWDMMKPGQLVPKANTTYARLMRQVQKAGITVEMPAAPTLRTYYPMSKQYSPFCLIPAAAHESYWSACVEVAADILKDPAEKPENRKLAVQFAQKIQPGMRAQLADILNKTGLLGMAS